MALSFFRFTPLTSVDAPVYAAPVQVTADQDLACGLLLFRWTRSPEPGAPASMWTNQDGDDFAAPQSWTPAPVTEEITAAMGAIGDAWDYAVEGLMTLDQAIEDVLSEVLPFPYLRHQSEFHDGPPTCEHDSCPTGRCTGRLLRAELAGAAVGAPAPEVVTMLPAYPRPGRITAPFWDLVLHRMGLRIEAGRYVADQGVR